MQDNIIKVQTFTEFPYKLVEWKLHDKCNYDCSFCGEENKAGKVGWADLATNKAIADSIIRSAGDKPLWVQFTGGEPTLYPRFVELVSYIKQQGAMISIITNGSRTIRWWKTIRDAKVLDLIYMTFHSHARASYQHLAEVSNLFLEEETFIINPVTYMADSIDYAFEGIEYILENTANIITMNAMDLVTHSIDHTDIGEEQFSKVLNDYNVARGKHTDKKVMSTIPKELYPVQMNATVFYADGSTEVKHVTQMMKLGENRFKDWTCYAGTDTMNIENGVKFRGGCKRDATPFTPDSLSFFDKPFACDVLDCYCALDMITTKIKV